MKLSNFFGPSNVLRDTTVRNTYYTTSELPESVTFAMDISNINKANNNPNIAAVITNEALANEVSDEKGLVISNNPKKSFFEVHNHMFENKVLELHYDWKISGSAKIHGSAIIGEKVFIGENVTIDKQAIIEDYSIIGDNTYIGPNAIIGARGMHNTLIDGKFIHVHDAGGVIIGQNCEILAGAVIQKSYFCTYTKIGDMNKISVMTNIGHNTTIGTNNLIAGGASISGFCSIGNNNWIGPSTVIAHNIIIGDNCSLKLGSVIVESLINNSNVSGNFAINHKHHLKEFIKNKRYEKTR